MTRQDERGVRSGTRFGPAEHLRHRRDFADLRRKGRRGGDSVVRVQAAPNGLSHSRLACAVPKRYGPAVARNRLRRQYREAFRLEKHRLPSGLDILLSPPRGAKPTTLEALRESIVRCVTRLSERVLKPAGDHADG